MATLLFKLNNVPDDEAQDIRSLLNEHDIVFYETDAGFFRVGLDAIWLSDASSAEQARELIHAYQIERAKHQQQNYAQLVEQGTAPTVWTSFCAQPIRFVATMVAVLLVACIVLAPFLLLLKM